jgi:hypothetical protein
MARAPKS